MSIYLYGVLNTNQEKSFGAIGLPVNGQPSVVSLIVHDGLAILQSPIELAEGEELPATRKNLLTHEKVLEEVMNLQAVIPFAFGNIVEHEQNAKKIIEERKEYFDRVLKRLEGHMEVNVKIMWTDMPSVYQKIVAQNEGIKNLRDRIMAKKGGPTQDDSIELGKQVEGALLQYKEEQLNDCLSKLLPEAVDHKIGKNIAEQMFFNVAFFIRSSDEAKFDEAVNNLHSYLGDTCTIKYIGPIAPYNFIE